MVILATPAVPFHTAPAFPRLADQLPALARPFPRPASYLPSDLELSDGDAAALDDYAARLDDEAMSADYDERAARVADEFDLTPVGADCTGFTLGSWDAPRELSYVPDEAGVMFVDDAEPAFEPAYL